MGEEPVGKLSIPYNYCQYDPERVGCDNTYGCEWDEAEGYCKPSDSEKAKLYVLVTITANGTLATLAAMPLLVAIGMRQPKSASRIRRNMRHLRRTPSSTDWPKRSSAR